ncbi:MAG: 6-bladed beta-propeller [Candidatus Aminicenantes bacterium]|nr:6-bladed beta-propeller [Candidatus Aminicenantes bacterium]
MDQFFLRVERKKLYLKIISAIMIALVWGLSVFLFAGQEVVRNPRKPISGNAGRVLEMQKVWQVGDEAGLFYFKNPHDLQVSSDGSIFVADVEQLLKFSADGRFEGNFYKKGQGPEEIAGFFFHRVYGNRLLIYDPTANKIIQMDLDGNFIGGLKLQKGPYNDFYGLSSGWFVFVEMVYPPLEKRTEGLHDVSCLIKLVSPDGQEEKEVYLFKMKTFLAPQAGASWDPWNALLSYDGRWLYVNCRRNYLVDVLDLKTGKLLFSFTRDYPSVKYVEKPVDIYFRKQYKFPKIEYEIDIRNMFLDKRFIWIQTSTTDRKKGDLFDIFDESGRFIDSFYSGLKGSVLAVNGNYVYVLEKDEKENLFLSKYFIVDSVK